MSKFEQHLQLTWQALTPVHAGVGQVVSGVVDLPVQREAGTGFPVIPASTIKGVLRDGVGLRKGDDSRLDADIVAAQGVYGYADRSREVLGQDGQARRVRESAAGTLTLTDARLLLLAVPSFFGTFALVTSPLVISRLSRMRVALGGNPLPAAILDERADGTQSALVANEGSVILGSVDVENQTREVLFLQDFDLDPAADAEDGVIQCLAEALGLDGLTPHVCVVSDLVFSTLCETSLDVTAHNRLDPDTKTVARGALWWEECIPAESVLTSFALCTSQDAVDAVTRHTVLQVGGKATVGRGLMALVTKALDGVA